MRVLFHPEFAQDVLRFGREYGKVSDALRTRFRLEIDHAIEAIQRSPRSAGHFLECESKIIERFADVICAPSHSSFFMGALEIAMFLVQ